MSPLLEYMFKLSVSLSAVGLFYHFVLRKHTFYNWNRWYLLGYSALAFFIPFINVSETIEHNDLAESRLLTFVPAMTDLTHSVTPTLNFSYAPSWKMEEWIILLLVLGTTVMFIRFFIHFISYLKIRKSARLVSDEGVKIYHLHKDIVPFSFGNSIFINPDLHDQSALQDIILHEFVHIKQRHSFDIIFGELLCILNWFNPFAWLIRFSIRQNLEYIADRQVLENGVDRKEYQYLLLKVVGVPEFHIANQFNFSSLKQRIVMMNKVRTSRVHLIRFLFVFPILLILILACRSEIEDLANDSDAIKIDQSAAPRFAGYIVDGASGEPVADFPLTLKINAKEVKIVKTDENGFYYWDDQKWKERDSFTHYTLGYENSEYKGFIMGSYLTHNRQQQGRSFVIFVSKTSDAVVRTDMYFVDHLPFYKMGDNNKTALAQFLNKKKIEFTKEYNLKAAFRQAYPKPVEIITRFGNGYFNQEQKLVGYDDLTQFYLDGKKVGYQDINETFKHQQVAVLQTNQDGTSRALNKEMFYLTFSTYKTAPPSHLVKNNVELLDAGKFDMGLLEKQVYFLDGFRQVFGVGSNLKPLKNEIKKVILFTGDLAKYYDKRLEKVLWIETRPESEVFERPDLAAF